MQEKFVSSHLKQYNRHILSMMGVAVWVNRRRQTQAIVPMTDGLRQTANPRLAHLLSRPSASTKTSKPQPLIGKQSNDIVQTHKDAVDKALPLHTVSDGKAITPIEKKAILPKTDTLVDVPTHSAQTEHIRYQLQAVRYQEWVLVVDMSMMTQQEHLLWMSLNQALARHATQANLYYRHHQISYPLVQDEYVAHQGLNPAKSVFLGFVLGMTFDKVNATKPKVVFLSPLTQGLQYEADDTLPSVSQMLKDEQLKKQLWAKVVG